MKITELTIQSFKGIEILDKIALEPHINLFVGQNDSGKSSILEAIEKLFSNKQYDSNNWIPHISPGDLGLETRSKASVGVDFLETKILFKNWAVMEVPSRLPDLEIPKYIDNKLCFTLETSSQNGLSEFSYYYQLNWNQRVIRFNSAAGGYEFKNDSRNTQNLISIIKEYSLSKVFYFSSQRYDAGECNSSANKLLDRNANNFPNCLANLKATPEKFKKYLALVQRVLPNITDIVTIPIQTDIGTISIQNNGLKTRILIYKTSAIDERLGIPLNDCGTGVSQILVMLYVLSQQDSGIIIIDEPGSFLNPSAEKAFVKIIKEYTNFQFILATHSAPLISGSLPCKVYQCHWNVSLGKTEVQEIDADTLEGQKNIMYDLGISFTDVFGASAILWVEGPTEKGVFDLLLPQLRNDVPKGLDILPMPNASWLDNKKAKIVDNFFDLHDKVSQGSSLWPTVIGFTFDKEDRTKDRMIALNKRSKDKINWLPAKMIECFFLNDRALAALLSYRDTENNYEETQISAWRDEQELEFDAEGKKDLNAAEILKNLFSNLTETRCEYHKIRDGAWLADWFLKNEPDDLSELVDFLKGAVKKIATEIEHCRYGMTR